MNIDTFTNLVRSHAGIRPLLRYETDVPDYRFGSQQKTVAVSFEQNSQSTKFEFRIGYLNGMIKKFNELVDVKAYPHDSNKDMLVVTIRNNAFTDQVITVLDECARKAVNKYFQAH
jgi:hypothetical protein